MTTRLELFNWLKSLISDPSIKIVDHRDAVLHDSPVPTVAIEIDSQELANNSKQREESTLTISITIVARKLSEREGEVERIRSLLRNNATPDTALMELELIESETNAEGERILYGSRLEYSASLVEEIGA